MNIKCIAVDDEPLALKQLSDYVRKTPFLELIAECNSAFEALKVLGEKQVDLMFLDINMPDLNGIDFIKSLEERPEVIFTTAYQEYALEGFRVEALDYLLKPIGYDIFLKSANKAKKHFELIKQLPSNVEKTDNCLFIKSEYKIIRVNLNEIKYIEGMREYVRMHLLHDKPVMTLMSMKSLEEQLPANTFMRVHRSFIINLERVTTIERNRIIFDEKVFIPIGDQYKAAFDEYIEKHFLK